MATASFFLHLHGSEQPQRAGSINASRLETVVLLSPDDALAAAQRCWWWLATGAVDVLTGLEAVAGSRSTRDGARRFLGCLGLPGMVTDHYVAAAACRPDFCRDAAKVVRLARLPPGCDVAGEVVPPADLAGSVLEGVRWGACVASGVGRLVCAVLAAASCDQDVRPLVNLVQCSPRLPLVLPWYRMAAAFEAGRDPLEVHPLCRERRLWHPARIVQAVDRAVVAGAVTAAGAQAVLGAVVLPFVCHPEAQGQEMPLWLCDFVDTLGDAAEDGGVTSPVTLTALVAAFRQAESDTPLKVLQLAAPVLDWYLAGSHVTATAMIAAALGRVVAFPVDDPDTLRVPDADPDADADDLLAPVFE